MHCNVHHTLVLCAILIIGTLRHGSTTEAASCGDVCHYVSWARDADCSRRALQSVPGVCQDSKTLNLNKNNITEVPSGIFRSFGHLKYLQMLENHIHVLSPNAFAGAPKLKCINLLKNSLKTVPLHAFNDTASLKWIYMSRNKITSIDSGVFQETSSIEMLYLDENELETLDRDIFSGLTMMQRLLLGGNHLRLLPDGIFRDMALLDFLDLSMNDLRTLSVNTFAGLSSLEVLKLSGNGLVEIVPGTFRYNPVAYLDISGNDLTGLAWDQGDFEAIEDIEAAGNKWYCSCSLDPFRAALLEISLGADSTVICAGPDSLAHTDITSHSTLCPTSTPQAPTSKRTTRKLPNHKGVNYLSRERLEFGTTEAVLQSGHENSPVKITLIAVVIITICALTGMAVFLLVIIVLPRIRKHRKDPSKGHYSFVPPTLNPTDNVVAADVSEKTKPVPV